MQLTHAGSPLAQVGQPHHLSQRSSNRPLSSKEQSAVKQILIEGYDYVHHELFDQSEIEAARQLFDEAPPVPTPDTGWYHPAMNHRTDAPAQRHVKSVRLSAKQERALFLQFNYCRFKVSQARQVPASQTAIDPAAARRMLKWHRQAEAYRDQIIQTNLALVLAMVRQTRVTQMSFADLVSEGNMALLRAVDKFDVGRGFKFSTYACRAILKALMRAGMKVSKYRQMFPVEFDPGLERSYHQQYQREQDEADCIDELKRIIRCNQAELSEIEQEIVQYRFAINTRADRLDTKPLTLEQVGQIIGVTKERIRQIQSKALSKLRAVMQTKMDGWEERCCP